MKALNISPYIFHFLVLTMGSTIHVAAIKLQHKGSMESKFINALINEADISGDSDA